ncbi:hypothetical protein KLU848_2360 [Kluyveromyces marxianus]|uniref:Uncharacterized protein n=2 Tax=Kluyveromyces marxianus TaxID=4911 RepID=W0TBE9_KLUMD|nr:hypothetical protein KLMA_40304 [Kluyveromyces marxianus DMKU3-1042]KAG0669367.1 hypothetical protein C6P43_003622 [Kluyveromyces marxianus]KAG0678919.1 hypothetical protein C6P41_000876 [Kluyveromyces marxianus]QGN16059.1 protein YKL068W-A [Kluyveromyces marxianus]BAO40328.1 hypothetical protein KLMA_40304 [Kluyveromyces marxianus DMKU3-1042]
MFTDITSKARETQQLTPVVVQCFKNTDTKPRSTPELDNSYYDSDEEEDLIVDLTTGSLKPIKLKSYLIMNEVINGLESL